MLDATESDKTEDARILLDLLSSVERDGDQSQRRLASELGIALGLVNAYLRRCVRKGLVKVTASACPPLHLLSDTARLCRKITSDRRIPLGLLRLFPPRQGRMQCRLQHRG